MSERVVETGEILTADEPPNSSGSLAADQVSKHEAITEVPKPSSYISERAQFSEFIRANEESPLTPEEEINLARTYQAGLQAAARLENAEYASEESRTRDKLLVVSGRESKRRFLMANLRLVGKEALSYQNHPIGRHYGLMDMFVDGFVGMEHALEKFDPEKGYKFSTYATWWIRQAISRALQNTGTTIRVQVDVHEKFRYYSDLVANNATDAEIMDTLNIDEGMLARLHDAYYALHPDGPLSINEEVQRNDGDTVMRGDIIEDPRSMHGYEKVIERSAEPQKPQLAPVVVKTLQALDPVLNPGDVALLEKIMHGETLKSGEISNRAKLFQLFEHPAVREIVKALRPEGAIDAAADWRNEAACIGHVALFASSKVRIPPKEREARIKAICARCIVRDACAEYVQEKKPKRGWWVDGTNGAKKRVRRQAAAKN